MRALSNKQIKFLELYYRSGNAAQSAVQAGYSSKGARVSGHRVLQREDAKEWLKKCAEGTLDTDDEPVVTMAIPPFTSATEYQPRNLMGKHERMDILADLARGAYNASNRDRLTALDMLAKMHGDYAAVKVDNRLEVEVHYPAKQLPVDVTDEIIDVPLTPFPDFSNAEMEADE